MPTNETILSFGKGMLAKLLLLSIGCILVGIFFVIRQSQGAGKLLTLFVLGIFLGVFTLLVGFLLGTLYFRQIIKNGPALIIDNAGFTDYSSALAAGYIPWSEVRAIKIVSQPKYKQR